MEGWDNLPQKRGQHSHLSDPTIDRLGTEKKFVGRGCRCGLSAKFYAPNVAESLSFDAALPLSLPTQSPP